MNRGEFVAELLETWENLKSYEEQLANLHQNPERAKLHSGAAKELDMAIRTLQMTYTGTELGVKNG